MNDPNWHLPPAPWFAMWSPDFTLGASLPESARSPEYGGLDRSPELCWSVPPRETQSFVLTMLDPDAPTGSGFWHWVVLDLPATLDGLPPDAGNGSEGFARQVARPWRNELGQASYHGAAPPAGDGPHRYVFTLTALDVAHLEVPETATPALVGFAMSSHVVGRAQLVFSSMTPAR